MEAPPGPLRSPDGLWWWDGKAWQPIATLDAPPPSADTWQPPAEVAPAAQPEAAAKDTGAWQPPAGTEERPSDGWQPPSSNPEPTKEVATTGAASTAWQPPGSEKPAPPPAVPVEAPAAAPEPAADAVWDTPVAQAPAQAPPVAKAPVAQPETVWQPPPPPGQAPSPPPPVAGEPPRIAPPPPPPPPAAATPPKPEVPWPNWLPRNERSEAVVEDVPLRLDPGAVKPPPAPASPMPAATLPISNEARTSSWVSQLYPAGAALNANRRLVTYVGLGILGLIALYVLVQVLSTALGNVGSGATPTDTGPTGTQFQQADGFLVNSLTPSLNSLATPVNRIPVDCGGTHSVTCRSTLEDADAAMVKAIAIIDKGGFPSCMSAPVVQTRRDLVYQDQALKSALIGFRYNNDTLVTKGLADFAVLSPALKTDLDALKAAQISACPKSP